MKNKVKPCLEFLTPRSQERLKLISDLDFRDEIAEIEYLIYRRYLKLKNIQQTGKDEPPATKQKSISAKDKSEFYKTLIEERKKYKEDLNTVLIKSSKRKPTKKALPKNIEGIIFKKIIKDMEKMGYLLVDIESYVPKNYRPLDKSKVQISKLLQRLEEVGFFISLNLEKAQEEHQLVFNDHHDFFLGKQKFAF
ncbi:hypothetical protein ACFL35_12300 [Candidatus Riflebacteria bacterium]